MKWPTTFITVNNIDIEAIAPVVISASRATDIPAFYSKWFFNALERGWTISINPFNGKTQYVSFQYTRVIVFWTKNPRPIIPFLHILDEKGIGYYFLYTLNDYQKENIEPGLPSFEYRQDTFIELSNLIGKEKVNWRFDPILLTNSLSVQQICERIESIGEKVGQYTSKLIISFVDIGKYSKVKRSLEYNNLGVRELTVDEKDECALRISRLVSKWQSINCKLNCYACAQDIDLAKYAIVPNSCIDAKLMLDIFEKDEVLVDFIHEISLDLVQEKLKDKGQRKSCGCFWSKDIGRYNTCPNFCAYCYANASKQTVISNYNEHNYTSATI